MKYVFTLPLLLVAATACRYQERSMVAADTGGDLVLRLEDGDGDGTLQYCDANNVCSDYPNPGDCAVLEITIDTATGRACERCIDANGNESSSGCDNNASVGCAIITAPDPDCMVCAYFDGAVIYSSCTPSSTNCRPVDRGDGTQCEVCYDSVGNIVVDECGTDCGRVACPEIACGPGYMAAWLPGECCPYCVPEDSCGGVVCSQDTSAIPDCPSGTTLVRDPTNCCSYYCAQTDCTSIAPMPPNGCPAGYYFDDTYPSCGRCTPDDARPCASDGDCFPGEYCTTSQGACMPPQCDPNNGGCSGAPDVCYGTCSPSDPSCPPQSPGDTTASCGGYWVEGGVGSDGCPTPPQCVCEDGSTTFDGTCPDQCANVYCFAAPPDCDANTEILVMDYPYCCGQCMPRDQCAGMECPTVECGPGFSRDASGCCGTCVRDSTACNDASSCLSGESCIQGTCQPSQQCEDSDGVDPHTAGHVQGYGPDAGTTGSTYSYADHCGDNVTVVEYSCYAPFAGSAQTTWQATRFSCPNGCREGACLP